MNPKVRTVLVIVAKNAVNAVLTNAGLMATMSASFHLHSWDGIKHILEAAGSVVASREAMVWLPKLIAWSQAPIIELSNVIPEVKK